MFFLRIFHDIDYPWIFFERINVNESFLQVQKSLSFIAFLQPSLNWLVMLDAIQIVPETRIT